MVGAESKTAWMELSERENGGIQAFVEGCLGCVVQDFSGHWKDLGLLTVMKITLVTLRTLNIWKSLGSSALNLCPLL